MEESASESSDYESDLGPPVLVQDAPNNNKADDQPPQLDAITDFHNCAKCRMSNNTDKKEGFSAGGLKKGDNSNSTEWIQCDACDEWYHIDCVGVEEYYSKLVESYHCSFCEPKYGPSKEKQIVADHRYEFWKSEEIQKPVQIGTKRWIDQFVTREKDFSNFDELILYQNGHQFMQSFDFDKEWKSPLKILKKDGLGMELPSLDFDMEQLVNMVGDDEEIETIDVYMQTASKMSMGKFYHFWKQAERERLFNMLSFEFSHTELMKIIKAPEIMYRLSWAHKFWPPELEQSDNYLAVPDHFHNKPDVSMFCLLGMAGSYTDFHIDFGGSSVWYHVFRGEKVFYVLEPTEENLEAFVQWNNHEDQSEMFLNDTIASRPMKRVVIKEGETLMIPSGWIHAVYTPVDSMVFGGNFIHELNISRQLKVYDIELRCNFDDHYLFPFFELTNWYAALDAVERFNSYEGQSLSPEILSQCGELLSHLNKWVLRDKTKNPKYQVHNIFRLVQEDMKKMITEFEKEQQNDIYDPANDMKVKSLKVKLSKSTMNGKKKKELKRDRSYDKAVAKAEKLPKKDKKSLKNMFVNNGTQSGRTIKPSQWVQEKAGIESQPGPSSGNMPFLKGFSTEQLRNIENAEKADDDFAKRNGDSVISSDDDDEIPKKKRKTSVMKEAKTPKTPKPPKPQSLQQRMMKSMKCLKRKF